MDEPVSAQGSDQASRQLPDRIYEIAAEQLALLAMPTRLRSVCALTGGERTVGQLAVSQPKLLQHLNTLYRGGVLGRRLTGAQVYYRIEHPQVRQLCMRLLGGALPQ